MPMYYQSPATPPPRNCPAPCWRAEGLEKPHGQNQNFLISSLAGEKEEGWQYAYFDHFLMTTASSLGIHDFLLKKA